MQHVSTCIFMDLHLCWALFVCRFKASVPLAAGDLSHLLDMWLFLMLTAQLDHSHSAGFNSTACLGVYISAESTMRFPGNNESVISATANTAVCGSTWQKQIRPHVPFIVHKDLHQFYNLFMENVTEFINVVQIKAQKWEHWSLQEYIQLPVFLYVFFYKSKYWFTLWGEYFLQKKNTFKCLAFLERMHITQQL